VILSGLKASGKRVHEVIVDFSAKNLTGFAGMTGFTKFCERLGVENHLETLPLERKPLVYTTGRLLMALVIGFVLAMDRLQDVAALRLDKVLLKVLGWSRFPVQSTLSRFLWLFQESHVIALSHIAVRLLERFRRGWTGFESIHLDIDSHVRIVYGTTLEGAVRGYNPQKKGRRSYHPLLAFVGETRDFLWGTFRPGNATTHHIVDFGRRCLELLDVKRFKRVCVRVDSGFCEADFMAMVESFCGGATSVVYMVALKMFPHHQRAFCGVKFSPLPGSKPEDGLEVGEYQSTAWADRKSRRVVVIRQRVPESDPKSVPGKQLKLFELAGYAYRAFVTNSTDPPEQVWREYNGRATAENLIKEGITLGLDVNATRMFQANAAHLVLVMLAYNLLNWYKETALGQESEKHESKWVRARVLCVPGQLVKTARRYRLKLPKDWPWLKLLSSALDRLHSWNPAWAA
jgi:hypothetical protein